MSGKQSRKVLSGKFPVLCPSEADRLTAMPLASEDLLSALQESQLEPFLLLLCRRLGPAQAFARGTSNLIKVSCSVS